MPKKKSCPHAHCCKICDEYNANEKISGKGLNMEDFHTKSGKQPVTLEGGQMAKLLRYIVHTLKIFIWEQDYRQQPNENDVLQI